MLTSYIIMSASKGKRCESEGPVKNDSWSNMPLGRNVKRRIAGEYPSEPESGSDAVPGSTMMTDLDDKGIVALAVGDGEGDAASVASDGGKDLGDKDGTGIVALAVGGDGEGDDASVASDVSEPELELAGFIVSKSRKTHIGRFKDPGMEVGDPVRRSFGSVRIMNDLGSKGCPIETLRATKIKVGTFYPRSFYPQLANESSLHGVPGAIRAL